MQKIRRTSERVHLKMYEQITLSGCQILSALNAYLNNHSNICNIFTSDIKQYCCLGSLKLTRVHSAAPCPQPKQIQYRSSYHSNISNNKGLFVFSN